MKKEEIRQSLLKEIDRILGKVYTEIDIDNFPDNIQTKTSEEYQQIYAYINTKDFRGYYKLTSILEENINNFINLFNKKGDSKYFEDKVHYLLKAIDSEIKRNMHSIDILDMFNNDRYRTLNMSYLQLIKLSKKLEDVLQEIDDDKLGDAVHILIKDTNINKIKLSNKDYYKYRDGGYSCVDRDGNIKEKGKTILNDGSLIEGYIRIDAEPYKEDYIYKTVLISDILNGNYLK